MSLHFEVPLLPPADSEEGIRLPPYLFAKTSESAFFTDGTLRLTCAIGGADFLSKLVAVDPATRAAAKKRAKAPDLAEEPETKKAKKAKAKAKPKAKASGKKNGADCVEETAETAALLAADVTFKAAQRADVEGCRPRRWMDDLLAALEKAHMSACGKHLEPFDDTLTPKTALVGSLLSLGLEFALTGKVLIGKKMLKDWSKVPVWVCFQTSNSNV